jgi:hypothetical protein
MMKNDSVGKNYPDKEASDWVVIIKSPWSPSSKTVIKTELNHIYKWEHSNSTVTLGICGRIGSALQQTLLHVEKWSYLAFLENKIFTNKLSYFL